MEAPCGSVQRMDISVAQDVNIGELSHSRRRPVDPGTKYQISQMAGSRRPSKRERSQNWGQAEKCSLVELVQQRLAVIEDKAGDTDAVRRRMEAWREIHAEFTAKMGGDQRDLQRMREQWRRIKHWAKQEMRYYRETEHLDGNLHALSKQPNQLAQYICEIMSNYERMDYRGTDNPNFKDGTQDSDPGLNLRVEDSFSQENRVTESMNHATDADVVPVSIDVVPVVKQDPDDVEILDGEEVGMVEAPNLPSSPPPLPSQMAPSHLNQTARASAETNHLPIPSRKPVLPSWAKDFPDIVGADPAQDAVIDDEYDDEESDFLDDSDDDDDLGPFSDWARDQPAQQAPSLRTTTTLLGPVPESLPSRGGNDSRLERQTLTFARREFKRRMQMMEAEHSRKLQILDIQRETAQLKKKLAFRQLKRLNRGHHHSSLGNSYGRHGQR